MADSNSDTPTQKVKLGLANVIFGEATPRQRELISTIRGNPRPPITPQEYLTSQKKLSRPGTKVYEDIRYFCLFHKDDPDMIISTCEVNPRQALISDTSGAIKVVKAYGIANVYTPPQFRGQGMANFMLQRLREVLDQRGYEVGVLYSAIGREFYGRLGWKAFDTRELVISLDLGQAGAAVTPAQAAKIGVESKNEDGVHLLSETDIPPLCEKDMEFLSSKLQSIAKASHDENTTTRYVSLLPTYEQIAFHIFRDTYTAEALYTSRGLPKPEMYHGAITRDKKSWTYWDHGLPTPEHNVKLKALRIVTDPEDEVEKRVRDVQRLLKAAVGEARRAGLAKVVVWEPDDVIVEAAMGVWKKEKEPSNGRVGNGKIVTNVTVEDRKDEDGSLPCFRWSHDGGGEKERRTVWVNNEAFGWC